MASGETVFPHDNRVLNGCPAINQTTAANVPDLLASTSDDHLAKSLWGLFDRLRYMGRREEALRAMEEVVELYRQLAAVRPEAYNLHLAASVNNLSIYLSNMGLREDALQSIQEAVEFFRPLAADHPATFDRYLALSLTSLSNYLSDMGLRKDALPAIQEAVE